MRTTGIKNWNTPEKTVYLCMGKVCGDHFLEVFKAYIGEVEDSQRKLNFDL